jgi:hypothetical protein
MERQEHYRCSACVRQFCQLLSVLPDIQTLSGSSDMLVGYQGRNYAFWDISSLPITSYHRELFSHGQLVSKNILLLIFSPLTIHHLSWQTIPTMVISLFYTYKYVLWLLIIKLHFFVFLAVLGLELRAYTLSHSTSPFLWRFFSRWGVTELFAQAGFKPWSCWSLPSE